MGNGELVLRCACVLDVTAAILDVIFSVIVHALVLRLLLAISICSLLSVCDCSYSKLRLSKRAFLSVLSRHKYAQRPSCCCPQHAAWGHADDLAILRVATDLELRFCGVNLDGRHNNRKRKICLSCRDQIKLENKCDELQV